MSTPPISSDIQTSLDQSRSRPSSQLSSGVDTPILDDEQQSETVSPKVDSKDDHSGAHLVSGSGRAMFLDTSTGQMVDDWDESNEEYDFIRTDETDDDS